MSSPPDTRSWWKRLECRLDAWAARRMSPEEYAEAVVLDRSLKANFWRWLAGFVAVVAAVAVILVGVWPQLSFARAFVYSGFGSTYIVLAFISAWYGYRKYTNRPAWQMFAVFIALMVAGAGVGFAVGNIRSGRTLGEIPPEKLVRALAVALAIGVAMAGVLVGIAQLRLREAKQKAERLRIEAERERLARQGTQAELKLLQAQVEPHFLFNTLSNLRYMVQSGSKDALPMLDHLIHYLRTALPELRAESSTLGREAELARAYLEIMRLRMGGALEISIDVPQALAGASFPPLMVMTLVENAIKHGVAPVGRGHIALRVRGEGGRLRVEVEDDGRGLGGALGRGVGLANIRERLRALHGDAARLVLEGREPAGTLAAIEVPGP